MAGDDVRSGGRPLRRDAAANAERLLAAAVRTGLNEGKNVPLATIADEAGVGVGTLYRRYANRAALIEALQIRAYGLLIGIASDALAVGSTGAESVRLFLTESFAVRHDLVLPLHGAEPLTGEAAAGLPPRLHELVTGIVNRGHGDGSIRPEVTASTVVQFGALLAQPLSATPEWELTASTQREIFLRGIRPETPKED